MRGVTLGVVLTLVLIGSPALAGVEADVEVGFFFGVSFFWGLQIALAVLVSYLGKGDILLFRPLISWPPARTETCL